MSLATLARPRSDKSMQRTPERQKLADVIHALERATDRKQRISSGIASGQALSIQLRKRINLLQQQVDDASRDEPRRLAAQLMGDEPDNNPPLAECSKQLLELQREHAALQVARKQLDIDQQAADEAIAWAQISVRSVVQEVLRADPVTQALADRFLAVRREFLHLGGLMRLLGDSLPPGVRNLEQVNTWSEIASDNLWATALADLRHDPDAELPTVSAVAFSA